MPLTANPSFSLICLISLRTNSEKNVERSGLPQKSKEKNNIIFSTYAQQISYCSRKHLKSNKPYHNWSIVHEKDQTQPYISRIILKSCNHSQTNVLFYQITVIKVNWKACSEIYNVVLYICIFTYFTGSRRLERI